MTTELKTLIASLIEAEILTQGDADGETAGVTERMAVVELAAYVEANRYGAPSIFRKGVKALDEFWETFQG